MYHEPEITKREDDAEEYRVPSGLMQGEDSVKGDGGNDSNDRKNAFMPGEQVIHNTRP